LNKVHFINGGVIMRDWQDDDLFFWNLYYGEDEKK